MNAKTFTNVSQLTSQIKWILESALPSYISVKGEISNYSKYQSGNIYFVLKDEKSKIKIVMFANSAVNAPANLADGSKVEVSGRLSVYETDGVYQIIASKITQDGLGLLYEQYEALKKKLYNEGLFSLSRPSIPKYVKLLGVITSPDAAALADVLITVKRRNHYTNVYIFPTLVQGELAPASLIRAITIASKFDLDALIITRGGGSFEDLNAFNHEEVVRLVSSLTIPTISAIGHEIDNTLLDYVCSLRAPTPTSAAEQCSFVQTDALDKLNTLSISLTQAMQNKIANYHQRLDHLQSFFLKTNISNLTKYKRQRLQNLSFKLHSATLVKLNSSLNQLKTSELIMTNSLKSKFENTKSKLKQLTTTLANYNNNDILKRGFSILSKDNKIVNSINQLQSSDLIDIILIDGNTKAIIK